MDGWMDGRTTEMVSAPYYKLPPQFEEEAKNDTIYFRNNRKTTCRRAKFLSPLELDFNYAKNEYNIDKL